MSRPARGPAGGAPSDAAESDGAAGGGCYLVLEGPDGCGKSSQAERLTRALKGEGRDVVHLREPGSTPVGEHLRAVLLNPASGDLAPTTEVLLFTAARLEMFRAEVGPALARGAVVVAERCYLSTMVYQGRAAAADRAVDLAEIERLTRMAHRTAAVRMPDRVLVLDLDWHHATERMAARVMDRIEARGQGHWQAVRDAYGHLAGERDECLLLDARGPQDEVAHLVLGAARPLLTGSGGGAHTGGGEP